MSSMSDFYIGRLEALERRTGVEYEELDRLFAEVNYGMNDMEKGFRQVASIVTHPGYRLRHSWRRFWKNFVDYWVWTWVCLSVRLSRALGLHKPSKKAQQWLWRKAAEERQAR